MQRYFIHLTYDGTNYHGWQIQENANTVQQELQQALSTLFREEVAVVGCGRTDTGVHARDFYAHFERSEQLDELEELTIRLNKMIPRDIAIFSIFGVDAEVHTRFSALSRTYEYHVNTWKDPFSIKRSCFITHPIDVEKMNSAAQALYDYTDFTSFSKTHTQVKTNLCKIMKAQWTEGEGGKLVFTIQADRFLRNMVRAIVGTLFEVGKSKMTTQQFRQVIEAKDRSLAGTSVPAEGLYLTRVEYPESDLNQQIKKHG